MALWSVHLTLDLVVWVRPVARDTVLGSWAETLYSHSPSLCTMGVRELNAGGNPVMDWQSIQALICPVRQIETLLVALCYREIGEKLLSDGPLGSCADRK